MSFQPTPISLRDQSDGTTQEVYQDEKSAARGVASVQVAQTLQDQARRHVYNYVKARLEKTDTHVTFGPDEVYVVWFCKTLQNWKALLSTTLPDGMYYEVTYNGDKSEIYLDAYKKFDNVCIAAGDPE